MGSGTSRFFGKSASKKQTLDVEARRLQKLLDEKEKELEEANRIVRQLQIRAEHEERVQTDDEKARLKFLLEEKERELKLAHTKLAEYQAQIDECNTSPPRSRDEGRDISISVP